MSKEYTIATFNCENLFTRPSIFEEPDVKAKELLQEVDLLKAELKKPVFDHDEIKRLAKSLDMYATINDIRGKATSAKGAAEWLGYVSVKKTALKDESVNNIARVIADLDADIISLIEVEDRLTLKGFHDDILYPEFLRPAGKEHYPCIMSIQGNDGRGINVAVMSRVPINWMQSHVHERTGKNTPVFSRDCLEVNFALTPDVPLHLLVNHFKSMGYSSPGDPQGNKRRLVQTTRVAELLDEHNLKKEYVIVSGDFNSCATSPSLAPLLTKAGMYNVSEELPAGERGTYRTGKDQLDYIVVSGAMKEKLSAVHIERRGIYTARGSHYPTVTNRRTEASDHAAVVATITV
ncbi:MAG: endonuclease/exonuclease/phosphatase family protein [Methanoregula sp.]|nr:endonuclease/exonuclease/phosphatase family protein [Methanoregula sp.]